jgi:hypothetical protein
VPRDDCKSAAYSQNFCVARRGDKRPLVFVIRLAEVKGVIQNQRQCKVSLGEVRGEDKCLARISLRVVIAFTHRRCGLSRPGDAGKGDRSGGKAKR